MRRTRTGLANNVPKAWVLAATLAGLSSVACSSSDAIPGVEGPGPAEPGGGMPNPMGTESGGAGGAAAVPMPTAEIPDPPPGCEQPASAPLRRLNRFELSNTLADLFPGSTVDLSDLPESIGNGFYNDARSQAATLLLIETFLAVGRDLGAQVAADDAAAATFAGCEATDAACPEAFVNSFGMKAFRRPLTADEGQLLLELFELGQAESGFGAGVRAVIEGVVQLPQFLYRVEKPTAATGTNFATLSSYELATRLSYLIWGTTPDQTLLDAAAAGELNTREQVLQHAERMVEDPRAKRVVEYFHGELFTISGVAQLNRSTVQFPTFITGMGELFLEETQTLLSHIVFDLDGGMADFYTAPFTFLNEPLAKFYGVEGVTGDAFQKVMVDPAQRGGVLTHASILATTTPGSTTNPVVRGAFMNHQVLCVDVPPPPAALNVTAPEIAPGASVRDAFEQHRSDPECSVCHKLLDPVGFGFSHYDGVGLWQEMENGAPVDASGELAGTDVAGTFNGVSELSAKVATSVDVHNCYVGHWLTFAYGRLEEKNDECARNTLQTGFFPAGGGNVKDLLVAITQTDAFMLSPIPNLDAK